MIIFLDKLIGVPCKYVASPVYDVNFFIAPSRTRRWVTILLANTFTGCRFSIVHCLRWYYFIINFNWNPSYYYKLLCWPLAILFSKVTMIPENFLRLSIVDCELFLCNHYFFYNCHYLLCSCCIFNAEIIFNFVCCTYVDICF